MFLLSFFLYFFPKVSLLASASEFNYRCFLRCRCSMEMWCPDDIGRIGPATCLGESMIQLSRVGRGSPPVKTEPLQIVIWLLVFKTWLGACVCAQHSSEPSHPTRPRNGNPRARFGGFRGSRRAKRVFPVSAFASPLLTGWYLGSRVMAHRVDPGGFFVFL